MDTSRVYMLTLAVELSHGVCNSMLWANRKISSFDPFLAEPFLDSSSGYLPHTYVGYPLVVSEGCPASAPVPLSWFWMGVVMTPSLSLCFPESL